MKVSDHQLLSYLFCAMTPETSLQAQLHRYQQCLCSVLSASLMGWMAMQECSR